METRLSLQEPFGIPHTIHIGKDPFSIPEALLPRQSIQGALHTKDHGWTPFTGKRARCTIQYKKKSMIGGYGTIYIAERHPGGTLCVKAPHTADHSLSSEAVLQWYAGESLEAIGVHGAIPKVYDIFQFAGETRFSMEYIDGKNLVEFLLSPSVPPSYFLQALAQVTLLLAYLETTIRFDHRDLKVDNIWIRERVPIEYKIPLGPNGTWTLHSPFQVVLLDFGFSCLGNKEGETVVNLCDDIFSNKDRCPKEGRDLFQFLVSLWSISSLREKLPSEIHIFLERLLSYHGTSYASYLKKLDGFHWTYLTVSDPKFQYPPLHPTKFLEELVKDPLLEEGYLTKQS
jgi:serine/threonine protein kinase